MSGVIVTDIVDLGHLSTLFNILEGNFSYSRKLRDWELFESLSSEITSQNILTDPSDEAEKQDVNLQPLQLCHTGYRIKMLLFKNENTKYLT
jgi:hypothetical protein